MPVVPILPLHVFKASKVSIESVESSSYPASVYSGQLGAPVLGGKGRNRKKGINGVVNKKKS